MSRYLHFQSPASVGLLLVHGLTGMPSEMRPVEKHFKKRGFQVKVPLLKGHGGTHQDLLATNWIDWLDGISKELNQLSQSCQQVFVVGLCAGSLLATLLAAKHSQISGIALLSPTLNRFQKGHSPLERWLPLLLKCPFLFDKLYWEEKPPYGLKDKKLQRKIEQALRGAKDGTLNAQGTFRMYLGSFYQLALLSEMVKDEAAQVSCPALIIHSLEDTMAHPDNASLLHSLLGTENKTLHFIQGCDHMMTIDLKKHEINSLIQRFIERCLEDETCITMQAGEPTQRLLGSRC